MPTRRPGQIIGADDVVSRCDRLCRHKYRRSAACSICWGAAWARPGPPYKPAHFARSRPAPFPEPESTPERVFSSLLICIKYRLAVHGDILGTYGSISPRHHACLTKARVRTITCGILTQRFWTSEEGQDEILVLTAVSRVDTFTMQVGQYPAAGGFIHDAH